MSNVHTGTVNEKRCEDLLIEMGYRTWRTRRQRFGNMDMFGLFDVVGLYESKDAQSLLLPHLLFIQVKTNYCPPKVKEAIRSLHMPPRCHKQVWVWKDRLQAFDKEEIG